MGGIAKGIAQYSWAGLAAGWVVAIAAAGILAFLILYLRRSQGREDDIIERGIREERRQRLLYCGDVKALADLAIQRHMSDAAFLQHCQNQPCYKALLPHFSDAFRERLAQKFRPDGHADLATACRLECERLEQLWQLPEFQGLSLQNH